MPKQRFCVTPIIQSLFCQIPVETSLTDDEIGSRVDPHCSAKTVWRLRTHPPSSVSREQLLLIARLGQAELGLDAANLIGAMRDPGRLEQHPLLAAEIFARSEKKEMAQLANRIDAMTRAARRLYLYDRDNSFDYFNSATLNASPNLNAHSPTHADENQNQSSLRYIRRPRISVFLSDHSLHVRAKSGDEAIEELLNGIYLQEHSLSVISDSLRLRHRILKDVFADIRAITICDRTIMLVLPQHARSLHLYEASKGPIQTKLIRDSLRLLLRMRRFRIHEPSVASVTELLRQRLSYRLPWQ